MKNKNSILFFSASILLLSVFFVQVYQARAGIDGGCYSECMDYDSDDAYCSSLCDDGSSSGGSGGGLTQSDCSAMGDYVVSSDGQDCVPVSSGSQAYDQNMCNQYYGPGYVPNADGSGCDPTESTANGYTYTQSMCDQYYGSGYAPNSDGTGCEAVTPTSGVGADCLSDSDCGRFGIGYECNDNATCVLSSLGQQFSNAFDSVGGTAIQLTAPLALVGGGIAPIGSFVLPNGTVLDPTGLSLGTSGGTPVGSNIVVPGSGSGGTLVGQTCADGFDLIGGVCFPSSATTGLPDPQGGVGQIIANLFSWLIGIFTTVALIAFIISGLQYLTSAGDEHQIETAKRNATWSFVGILVGLSGFVIIQAIASALSANPLI